MNIIHMHKILHCFLKKYINYIKVHVVFWKKYITRKKFNSTIFINLVSTLRETLNWGWTRGQSEATPLPLASWNVIKSSKISGRSECGHIRQLLCRKEIKVVIVVKFCEGTTIALRVRIARISKLALQLFVAERAYVGPVWWTNCLRKQFVSFLHQTNINLETSALKTPKISVNWVKLAPALKY